MKKYIAVFLLALFLSGCGNAAEIPPAEPLPSTTLAPETIPEAALESEAAVLTQEVSPPISVILEPEAPGIAEERCEDAVVDFSNTADGYIMARYLGHTDRRLKVLVKGPTTTYQYNLPLSEWVVLPLSDGDGTYQAGIYRNTDGSKYAMVMMAEFEVTLSDDFAPFLRPNQYVNYLNAPATTQLGAQLCAGLTHPLEKVAAVYEYVVQNLSYDKEKAATVKSGYLPVLDDVLARKAGICFDYAALMTAMLRCQEVPCKLVVGYAGSTYHAWISVWTEEDGWVDGVIFFDGHSWKRMDPTFASSEQNSQEILDFIENGTYTVKYLY